MRKLIFAVYLLVFPAITSAQDSIDESLTIELTGTIEPRCELSGISSEAVTFADGAGNVIDFNVYCNVEMSIRLESKYGGLLNTIAADKYGLSDEMYKRYIAELTVNSIGFEKSVSSTEMIDGATFPVTGGVAFESSGSLKLELQEDGLREGHAGVYSDQIKISVFPSLSSFN